MKRTLLLIFFFAAIIANAQVPNWTWARGITNSSNDGRQMTAADADGNVYVTGTFQQPTITIGGTTLTNVSTHPIFFDIYVVKYDRTGAVVWAKSFGGPAADAINSIVVDDAGNLYVVGVFQESIDFGGVQLTTTYPTSFWAKLNSDGDVIWAKTGDASNLMTLAGIAVDATGQVYLSGSYSSPTISINGQTLITYEGFVQNETRSRPMVLKVDANGDAIWGRAGQSSHNNVMGCDGLDVAVDAAGNVFMTGRFNVNTISFGTHQLTKTSTYTHGSNMYIVKYNSDGVAQWAKNAGTIYENNTHGNGVEVDANGNSYVVGFFSNTISWDNISIGSGGGSYGFLVKFNPEGVTQWAKAPTGGSGAITYDDIDLDDEGNIYLSGASWVTPLNFGNGVTVQTNGDGLGFVTKFSSDGQALWARKVEPMTPNFNTAVSVVTPNEIYLGGEFSSASLMFAPYSIVRDTSTNWSIFLARLYFEPLSVDEHGKAKVSVYPNPTADVLNVTNLANDSAFEIFDSLGRKVKVGTLTNEGLNVSDLNSGVYSLKIRDEQAAYTVKFVKS